MAKGDFTKHGARLSGRGVLPSVDLVAGAAANTNIAVAGIKRRDLLLSVIENAAGTLTDRTATTSITSDGNIQCTVDTTGDQLLVYWFSIRS
jgi:hypothetical protein